MNRRAMVRLLMTGGVVMAFAAGHRVARSFAGTRDHNGASVRHSTAGFGAGFEDRGLTRDVAAARSWEGVKERVVARWEASPAPMVDYELRDETMRLLEKVSVADLGAWLRALRSFERTDYDKDVPLQLREMVLEVLARREGSSFIRSLVENPTEEGERDVEDAMDHWLEHDPVAALDWLDGQVPEVISEDLDDYREDALESLAGKNPAEFEKRLSLVDADVREDVLEDYARRRGTAEGRDGLLARAAGSPRGEAMALWKGLLRRESSHDPERAYATLAQLDLSPEDRAALDEGLVCWLLYATEEKDRADVMQAWMERNPGESVPEGILKSFEEWSQSDREGPAAWVAELPSGPRYDAFAMVLVGKWIADHEAVAGMVARVGDADIRNAMQRRLKESWQERDAAAAAEWERGLPEEERERLKETGGVEQ